MATRRAKGGFELPNRDDLRKAVLDVVVVSIFGGTCRWIVSQWSGGSPLDRLSAVAVGALVAAAVAWIFVPPRTSIARVLMVIFAIAGAVGSFVVVDPGPSDGDLDACDRPISDDALEVMVVWQEESDATGITPDAEGGQQLTELEAFCEVVGEAVVTGRVDAVEVVDAGDNIGAALNERFRDGAPPDVAIIPQPSLVRWYGHHCRLLEPINEGPSEENLLQRFPNEWQDLVTTAIPGEGPQTWGVFVKAAYKSMFWYSRSALRESERGGIDPTPQNWSWDDLSLWVRRNTGNTGFEAPLTLAGAEEWTFTDWFENQLAAGNHEVYTDLATRDADWNDQEVRDAVETALNQMTAVWRNDRAFTAGAEGVLDTRLEDLDEVLLDRRAAMVFGASFVGAQGDLPGNEDVWVSGFPRASGSQPVVVGGDVAVVPQQPEPDASTEAAHDFVEWLVTSEAMTEWGRHDRGFLAPNLESPIRQSEEPEDDVRRVLTSQLVDEDPLLLPDGPRPFLFDLSDNQLTIRDGDDQHRVWRDFTRFFRKVTAGPRTAEQGAIAELMGGLERYYEQSRQLDESQCPA